MSEQFRTGHSCFFLLSTCIGFVCFSTGAFKKSHSTHNLASSASGGGNQPSLVVSPAAPEKTGGVSKTPPPPMSANRSRSPKPSEGGKVYAVTPVSTAPYNKYQRKSSPKIGVSSLAANNQSFSASSHNIRMGSAGAAASLSPFAPSPSYTPMISASNYSSSTADRRKSSASLLSDDSVLLDSSSVESGFAEEANLVGLCTGNPFVIFTSTLSDFNMTINL